MEQKAKLTFGEINYKNLEQFKVITQKTLPVTYSENFYIKILTYSDFSTLGYYNDIAVGAITARIEEKDGRKTAYIMTFGVLDAYRRLGFGTQLLNELTNRVKSHEEIRTIYLHMWVSNEIGFQFLLDKDLRKQLTKKIIILIQIHLIVIFQQNVSIQMSILLFLIPKKMQKKNRRLHNNESIYLVTLIKKKKLCLLFFQSQLFYSNFYSLRLICLKIQDIQQSQNKTKLYFTPFILY